MTTTTDPTPGAQATSGDPREELLAGVRGTTPDLRDTVSAANREVRSAAAALRSAVDELHHTEDKAWRSYADEIDRALLRLDAELQVAAAQLRAERAESREDLSTALREVADTWRSRVDDVRVQATLARMETADTGRRVLAELASARGVVEGALRRITEDLNTTMHEARADAVGAIREAAAAIRAIHLVVPADEPAP